MHMWATQAGHSVLLLHTMCWGQPDTTQSSRSSGTWPDGGWWSESFSLSSWSKMSFRSCSSHWRGRTATLGGQLEQNIQNSNKFTKSKTEVVIPNQTVIERSYFQSEPCFTLIYKISPQSNVQYLSVWSWHSPWQSSLYFIEVSPTSTVKMMGRTIRKIGLNVI